VGTLRVSRDQDTAGVYGFVVHPDHQGHGIGRDVLRRVCRQALADGATRVRLEVEVTNDRALGLYTSLGFALVTTEDYYALPL
jgi:ribosomal protein S18 acetylase RimI-like enzyme